MTVGLNGMMKFCARAAVIGMVAFGASACSSVPNWVDPTNWFGGGPDDSERAAGETPDLASIPDRPAPASTPDEQRQVADSLAQDRSQAKYSADALRGGTEPAAAPPAPEESHDLAVPQASAPAPVAQAPASSDTQIASNDQPASAPVPAPAQDTSATAASVPAPSTFDVTPPPATREAAPMPAPAPAQSTMAMVSPSDAALGFKPSSAPPLDPTIGQFVPAPIIAHYQQTSGQSSVVRTASAAPAGRSKRGVGGPEKMSGAVVANLEAIGPAQQAAPATVYAGADGASPASVVLFPGDGTLLNAQAKLQVRVAVEQFNRAGGQGFIRVVGHASSRTSNMPVEKHLELIFNKSQDRANAVAKEIIREGVPANHVLVEAVGDSQPVYYESMPKGEDGNRRAEIFLQS